MFFDQSIWNFDLMEEGERVYDLDEVFLRSGRHIGSSER